MPSDFNSRIVDSTWFLKAVPGDYLNLPVNNPNRAYDKGLELSWQTNFWYLPGLLKGIVLDVNYTALSSKTQYPYIKDPITSAPGAKKQTATLQVYNVRSGALVDMPNSILNIILGYDLKGFSGRVSYRYQTKTLTAIDGQYNVKDTYYAPFSLFDLNLSQKINKYVSCFANWTNIGNHVDKNYLYRGALGNFPTTENYYGFRIDAGVRANF
jgi:hypothetical protein